MEAWLTANAPIRIKESAAGNLSVQLDKLAKAGYIEVEKTFRGKIPCTVCRITDAGRDAFADYVEALQSYIKR